MNVFINFQNQSYFLLFFLSEKSLALEKDNKELRKEQKTITGIHYF